MSKIAPNVEKWGRKTAKERYGTEGAGDVNRAKNMTNPQDPVDKRGPDYSNDTPNTWLRGGPNESAEGKPNFDRSK